MRFTIVISVLFHVAILALGFLVLPDFQRTFIVEPVVPVEILREAELAEFTSVPETTTEPEPEEQPAEPEPEIVPEIVEEPVQLPPEPEPEKEPEPEPEIEEPEPEPEPVKPDPPKPEKPKDDELDLDSLEDALKDIDLDKDVTAPREAPLQGEQDQERIGLGDKLTASEESKVRAAMLRCWSFDAGVPNAETLVVKIEFNLNRDGTVIGKPRVLNSGQIQRSGNPFWIVAERNAINAVINCAPYDFLKPERYETWKDFVLNFDPKEMAGL